MDVAHHIFSAVLASILGTAFFGVLYVLFRAGQGASRMRAKLIPQVIGLSKGKVSREFGWELKETPHESEFIAELAEMLRKSGAEVIR